MKLFTLTLLFQLLCVSPQDFTINVAPARAVPNTVYPKSIFYDEVGQFVYLVGECDPDKSFDNQTFFGGNYDAFITKLFMNSTRVWTRVVGGDGEDVGYKVFQNPTNSEVFLLGTSDSSSVDGQNNTGNVDAFLVKFSSNGTKLLALLFGSIDEDGFFDTFLDTQTQQLIIGAEYAYMVSVTVNDINNGSVLRQFQFANGYAYGIASAGSGVDCFVAGNTYMSFDNQTFYGGGDIFLTKMNYYNGTRYWSSIWGTPYGEFGWDVQFDTRSHQVFVVGVTRYSAMNGQATLGGWDGVLISNAENGTYLWTKRFGSSYDDYAYGLAIHQPTGTLFVVGVVNYNFGFVQTFAQNGTMFQLQNPYVGNYKEIVFSASFGNAFIDDYRGSFASLNTSSLSLLGFTTTPSVFRAPSSTYGMASTAPMSTASSFSLLVFTTTPILSGPPSSTYGMASTAPMISYNSETTTAASTALTSASSGATLIPLTGSTSALDNFPSVAPTDNVGQEIANGPETAAKLNVTIIYAIVAASFALFIAVLLTVCYFVLRPKQKQIVSSSAQSPGTSEAMSEYQQSTSTETQPTSMTTLMRSNFELSLPGYLLFENGQSFRIRKQIAKGGGGVVSVADILTPALSAYGTAIIVKTVGADDGSPLGDLPERQQKTFKQEVSIMHYFRNEKHISKLLGWCSNPACILMKFYPRGSLDKWIHSDSFKSKIYQVQFMQDISLGILAMHKGGFVHCDLKPQNVLVDTDEQDHLYCCLTDFGITQIVEETSLLVKDFAVANIRGLSTQYAAPEAFQRFRTKVAAETLSAELITKVDMYSLAIIMFELLDGQPWRKTEK